VHIDPDELQKIGEKFRTLVAQSAFSEGNEQINVTVSIGATLMHDNDTTGSLIQRADTLMYRSKKDGRNRVTTG